MAAETDVKTGQRPVWTLFRELLAALLGIALSGAFVWAALSLTHEVWPLVQRVGYWDAVYLALALQLVRMATVGDDYRSRDRTRRERKT